MNNFLALLFFLIPIVWFKYVNANYLTTKTFLFYFASSLALLALPDKLNLRKISKLILTLLAIVFIYNVGSHFTGNNWSDILYVFKTIGFASICLYIYSQNLEIETLFIKISWPFFIMWSLILGITAVEVFQLRVLDLNIKTDIILSTFGNINMFSEFLILSLPFFFLWLRHEDRIPKFIKLTGFVFFIFFLLYGRSRSAWMGLAAWFLFQTWRGFKKAEWYSLIIAFLLFAVSHITAPDASKISKFVPEAFSERSSLYLGSLELLRDRPFGIGIGQFMNEIVPYLIDKKSGPNEFAYFDQPHSEFLKWGIQYGWIFLGLSLCLIFLIALAAYRHFHIDKTLQKISSGFYLGFLIVLLPQLAFQFPFENPASILIIAAVLGLFLSSYQEGVILKINYLKYLLGVVALVGIANSFLYFTAIYLESAYPMSADLMNVVCQYYPADFRACYWKNKNLLQMKNIQAFKTEFKKDFNEHTFYCDNLRLVPEYFNYSQNEKKTCEALLLYKQIYKEQKHFVPEAFSSCVKYQAPFKFETAMQFNQAYRKWFND